MSNINWQKIIAEADRLMENSDRRYRRHNISLEAMSDEFAYRESIVKNYSIEFESSFIESIENEKLRNALYSLTKKQFQVIEMYFEYGLKQSEIAEIMNCKKAAVSRLFNRAIEKIIVFMRD